ncbi:MAG: ComF family protein [Pseudomonadota bacterium]
MLDALLPGQCLLCDAASGGAAVCPACLRGLPPVVPACPTCALPRGDGVIPCGACQAQPPPWEAAVAPLRYEFPVDRLIHRFKYRGDLPAGAALADAMALGPWPSGAPPEIAATQSGRGVNRAPWLVPVPLHALREAWRGYNQAAELARALAMRSGWPLVPGLRRIRATRPQTGLDARARAGNVAGAFRWVGPALEDQTVVLVDDVFTTGATALACAEVLKEATGLRLWTAARALPPGHQN